MSNKGKSQISEEEIKERELVKIYYIIVFY